MCRDLDELLIMMKKTEMDVHQHYKYAEDVELLNASVDNLLWEIAKYSIMNGDVTLTLTMNSHPYNSRSANELVLEYFKRRLDDLNDPTKDENGEAILVRFDDSVEMFPHERFIMKVRAGKRGADFNLIILLCNDVRKMLCENRLNIMFDRRIRDFGNLPLISIERNTPIMECLEHFVVKEMDRTLFDGL